MKKLLFVFGLLITIFVTTTISSCGVETLPADQTSELKEGEDGEKCCSKESKEACEKICTAECTDKYCSDACKAAWEAKKKGTSGEHEDQKCSDMKCGEGKCGHGDEEGSAEEG